MLWDLAIVLYELLDSDVVYYSVLALFIIFMVLRTGKFPW